MMDNIGQGIPFVQIKFKRKDKKAFAISIPYTETFLENIGDYVDLFNSDISEIKITIVYPKKTIDA